MRYDLTAPATPKAASTFLDWSAKKNPAKLDWTVHKQELF